MFNEDASDGNNANANDGPKQCDNEVDDLVDGLEPETDARGRPKPHIKVSEGFNFEQLRWFV